MPRGIPNTKRDDTGMRYTLFTVPLAPNPKNLGSTYLKSDSNTLWGYRKSKSQTEDADPPSTEQRRGSNVIVIHPGSRWLRVGKASDVNPVAVPNVIARKVKTPLSLPGFIEGVVRPRKGRLAQASQVQKTENEYEVVASSDDPFDTKLSAITASLRERMRFYKIRVTPNATNIATTFNERFQPDLIPEDDDPDWILNPTEEFYVGETALRLAHPPNQGYELKWPIHGTTFNSRHYSSVQVLLSDIETILRATLRDSVGVDVHDYKNYSVVLVIPDFYERAFVREFVNLLLVTMGFKQVCAQQESLATTYGAGISNACVVDIGAVTTSIACVDEGLVISDTRMSLNMGGDDITEFLYVLLERIGFPYRDINLSRWHDWNVLEDLKARICTLAEGDVALNLYDFVVRKAGQPTQKYGLRAYDEIILAPMCLFEPRVVEFDRKRIGLQPIAHPDVSEEIMEHAADHVTQAMMISTQHLMPSPPPTANAGVDVVENPPSESSKAPPSPNLAGALTPNEDPSKQEQQDVTMSEAPTSPPAAEASSEKPSDAADAEGESKDASTSAPAAQQQQVATASKSAASGGIATAATYPGGFAIDVCFEASKLPLDVAIFNSARAAGGDEKIRKYLQAVLIIGGTALIPGIAHALESRLQAIATPLVPDMEKVQIIPPPKDVDPRVLAWKGAAVLGKMDSVADLWVTASDWNILGMRGLKERCFYL